MEVEIGDSTQGERDYYAQMEDDGPVSEEEHRHDATFSTSPSDHQDDQHHDDHYDSQLPRTVPLKKDFVLIGLILLFFAFISGGIIFAQFASRNEKLVAGDAVVAVNATTTSSTTTPTTT